MQNMSIQNVGQNQQFPTRGVKVAPGKQEMALFNSIDPGVAGSHTMESTKNEQVYGQQAQQQTPPVDYYGNGYDPNTVDRSAVKSLMENIKQIGGGVRLEHEGTQIMLENISKVISFMGADLDIWLPDNTNPELRTQLEKIGQKLIPFLTKYADVVKKL